MEINFKNKLVVVTGGANGIGAASAILFLQAGAKVIIVDIDHKAEEIVSKYNHNCVFIECNLSNSMEIERTFAEIKKIGEIDVLINNAGIQTYGTVANITEELWDMTIGINLKAQFLCAKYALPSLLISPHPVIINVASVNGIGSSANNAAYVASKAGILGLTKSIAVDFAPKLRCVAVCPGAVDTPMYQSDYDSALNKSQFINEINSIHLLNRVASADEVANFILFLSSPFASFATGHYFRVDGGIGIRI